MPHRQLEPEGHRLGVNTVRAADHHGVLVLERPLLDGVGQPLQVLHEKLGRLDHQERQRRVDDVVAGQAQVDVPGVRPDVLGDVGDEGDHVVLDRRLDLAHARDLVTRLRPDTGGRLLRDQPPVGERVAHRQLDVEPSLELVLVVPDAGHLGARITGNHPGPLIMPRTRKKGPPGRPGAGRAPSVRSARTRGARPSGPGPAGCSCG